MPRLLVVEDDAALRRTLSVTLRARQFEVKVATNGRTALELLTVQPEAILLDLGLPDVDGVDLIALLRARTPAPIIVVSARQAQHQKVDALDAGADDYLTKPFSVAELVARIHAALRRPELAQVVTALVATRDFTLDFAAKTASRLGRPVPMSPTEWKLAEALVRNPGVMITSDDLLSQVWGVGYGGETHFLRIYVGRLRKKLEADRAHPRHFITVPGIGYRFDA